MGLIPFGGIKVSREYPTVSVRIVNNLDSLVTAELVLRRVGAYVDILTYLPTNIQDEFVEFTLDEDFFTLAPGRYKATFNVDSEMRTVFYLHYDDENPILVYNKATP